MTKKQSVAYIYLPGLGDGFDITRRFALKQWRLRGFDLRFVPMRWNDEHESSEQKLARVEAAIHDCGAGRVVIIGESAGGPVALMAMHSNSDRVSAAVTVCGYNRGVDTLNPVHYTTHPAFPSFVKCVDDILSESELRNVKHTINAYSRGDATVNTHHALIPGCQHIELPALGHMASITHVLLFDLGRLLKRVSFDDASA